METHLINPRDVKRYGMGSGYKDALDQPYIPHPSMYDKRFRCFAWPVRSILWGIQYVMIARSVMKHTWNSLTRYTSNCMKGPVITQEEVEDLITHKVSYEHYDSSLPFNRRSWKDKTNILCVMIPGVNASPMMYEEYCDNMVQDFPNMEFFTPGFARGINKPASELAAMIFPTVLDYIQNHEQSRIIIISFSNGARIGAYLDGMMKAHCPRVPVLFIGIGGAFLGTWMIYLAQWIGIANQIGDETCVSELTLNSQSCRTGLEMMRSYPNPFHEYHFFCSTDDDMIQPFTSSTPFLGQGEFHYVVSGVTHNGLLDHVLPKVLEIVQPFVSENKFF